MHTLSSDKRSRPSPGLPGGGLDRFPAYANICKSR
jgi:hypothetical protein